MHDGTAICFVCIYQVVFASHVGRPKHKRAMIGGALDGDVFLGKKVRLLSVPFKQGICIVFYVEGEMIVVG